MTNNLQLRPSKSLYATFLEAWESCGMGNLSSMIGELRDSRNASIYSTNSLIVENVGAQVSIKLDGDVVQLMQDLGVKYPGVEPPYNDTYTYNIILRAIANSEKLTAGSVAEAIFVHMLGRCDGDCVPDLISFNS